MYKLRLKKWGFQKNFKKIELAAAADAVRPFCKSGIAAPSLIVGQREVPMDRLKRHFGETLRSPHRPCFEDSNQLGSSTSAYQRVRDNQMQRHQASIPRVFLQASPGMSLFERTAYQIYAYYSWRLTKEDDCSSEFRSVPSPGEFYNLALDVAVALKVGSVHLVQPILRKLTMVAGEVVVAQHPDLLSTLLKMCSKAFENRSYGHYWDACMAYIYAIARRSLSESNPLLMLLDLRQHDFDTNIPYTVFLKLAREIALQQHHTSSRHIFDLDLGMVGSIKKEQGPEAASRFCSDRLCHYKELLGSNHWMCRRLSLAMADMCWDADLVSLAEDTCRELVDVQDTPDSLGADVPARAMALIAKISKHRKDYAEAATWFRHASVGFERLYGSDDAETQLWLYHAGQLEAKLHYLADKNTRAIEQQKSEQRRRRAEQVGFAIAELERELSQTGLDTGKDDIGLEGRTWVENVSSIDDDYTKAHGCSCNTTKPISVTEVDADINSDNRQHELTEQLSALETPQTFLLNQNGVREVGEPIQIPSSRSSPVGSTSCPSEAWPALPSDMTSCAPSDVCAGFCLNFQQHISASGEPPVEGVQVPAPKTTTNDQCALESIDFEMPVLGDSADFDDLCRMPYLDQQFEFMPSFTVFDTSNTLDINTTDETNRFLPVSQNNPEELLNFDNVVDDYGWLNSFQATSNQINPDLPMFVSYSDTIMMEFMDWEGAAEAESSQRLQ